jgi:hypothetical protein
LLRRRCCVRVVLRRTVGAGLPPSKLPHQAPLGAHAALARGLEAHAVQAPAGPTHGGALPSSLFPPPICNACCLSLQKKKPLSLSPKNTQMHIVSPFPCVSLPHVSPSHPNRPPRSSRTLPPAPRCPPTARSGRPSSQAGPCPVRSRSQRRSARVRIRHTPRQPRRRSTAATRHTARPARACTPTRCPRARPRRACVPACSQCRRPTRDHRV